jgi:hypothetical protein
MRKKRRSNRRSSASHIPLIIGSVATIIAVIVGLVSAFYYVHAKSKELAGLDQDTFCPKSGPTSQFIVLMDRTDALTEIQGEALKRQITAWAAAIPKHGALKIFEVGHGGTILKPVVSVCNPGDGSDANAIDSNPKMWRQRYEEKFLTPVSAMLSSMRLDSEAATSPILEGIQAVAVESFGPDSPSGPKTLMIVSDLLQNSGGFSLYKSMPSVEAFSQTPYAGSVRVNLVGVHVGIHLLHRVQSASRQTDALGKFWIQLLEREGAIVDEFVSVPG